MVDHKIVDSRYTHETMATFTIVATKNKISCNLLLLFVILT